MNLLVLDNYDSFTFNLVHLVEKISDARIHVVRNDQLVMDEVEKFDKILLSPGPGLPQDAGQMIPLIQQYAASKPILGVCLGHQAIAVALGGSLRNLSSVYHGVAHRIHQSDQPNSYVFNGLPAQFEVGRYHSWVVNEDDLPAQLQVTARDENGLIMAMQHESLDITGVQFHPESVLTPLGERMLQNWINHTRH